MANITKRTNKDGSTVYRIRVYVGEKQNGQQVCKSMTWTPPPTMRPTTADKEAQKQAALFEDKVRQGLVSFAGSTRFDEYATAWVENEPLAYKTRERYQDLLKRIIPAIGHIRLDKLQAHHLEEFYRNLAEDGVKDAGRYAVSNKLAATMKKRKITGAELSRLSHVAASTISVAAKGKHIRIEKAEQICSALNMDIKNLFTVCAATGKLSPKTIHHHHRLICAILAKAKRERIVPFNVAQEHATAPKLPRSEAKYFDDEQARTFLAAVDKEEDIRIKAALTVLLFTGMRRGELCGLSWDDFEENKALIYVRRASQWQKGRGIVEVPTKNESSIRCISIPAYAVAVLNEYRRWWLEHKIKYGSAWQGGENRLFIQDNGKPIHPDTINLWLERVLQKNNLPHITPHGLRHTFATLQLIAGVDIRTLQARTGHAQASTLINIYSHAIQSAQESASAALEQVLLEDTVRQG